MKYRLLFLLCCCAALVQAQQQGLDTTFGDKGIVLKMGPDPRYGYGDIRSVVVLPNGKFLVTGDSLFKFHPDGTLDYSFGRNGATKYYYSVHMLLQPDGKILTAGGSHDDALRGGAYRWLSNGGADSSFGVHGKITVDDSTDIEGLLLQPDGKVVLLGESNQKKYVAVFRYRADGRADSSFGENGRVFWRYRSPMRDVDVRGGALMADGRIIVGGDLGPYAGPDSFFAMRFLPDGALDTSLGHRGLATIPYIRPCTDVAVQPDGKILLAGYQNLGWPTGPPFLLARLNEDGSIDSGFADGGVAVYEWHSREENKARVMKLQPDGKILLAGRAWDSAARKQNFAIVRFLPDGRPDSSFGRNGALQTRIRDHDDNIYDIALQPDGKIIAVGVTERPACSNCNDGVMVRYLPDGAAVEDAPLPDAGSITLYPNPAGASLRIGYGAGINVQAVQLYDLSGRLLQQWNGPVREISLRGRARGIYLLRFLPGSGHALSRKFVLN